jgi:hypothetical protein
MVKIKGVDIEEPWSFDVIFPVFRDAYHALLFSYNLLYIEKKKKHYVRPKNAKSWHLEDIITDDLIKDEERLPKSYDYRIVNQQKDATKNTRIDIAVQWSMRFGHSYDIKVECKLLNKRNFGYIINGGLQKFKSNLYADKLSFAGMLFYNSKDSLDENYALLNERIEAVLSVEEKLNKYEFLENYNYTYKSTHPRASNSNIDLYTMILNFYDVISN